MKSKITEKREELESLEESKPTHRHFIFGSVILCFAWVALMLMLISALPDLASRIFIGVLAGITELFPIGLLLRSIEDYSICKDKISDIEKEIFFLENEEELNIKLKEKLYTGNSLSKETIATALEAEMSSEPLINDKNQVKYSLEELRNILAGPKLTDEDFANYRNKVFEMNKSNK